jgi:beta-glucosidase
MGKTLEQDGHRFRDLNGNGRLDPYEDVRRPIDERVEDLLGQMALEEKVGLMFHTMLGLQEDGSLLEDVTPLNPHPTSELVGERYINHFNVYQVPSPSALATWHNSLQRMAEETRLGIPITISSDPRHTFSDNPFTQLMPGGFSQWPEPPGLAAIGNEALVEEFADIARREYLAVGIRVALHPMADLGTEPRWARVNGTFGADAALAGRLVAAYIRGFQGERLGPESVACMTKHFPGGGPQKDGEDPHFSFGREQVYPGGRFDDHLIPFEAAFKAGTAQIMPYYGMPVGLELEEVGFGFNREVITDLLRGRYGFDGVVCTDWRLLTDASFGGQVIVEAKCWGVEALDTSERAAKAIAAGIDQFGGEACTSVLTDLVHSGAVAESRIDESARRILRDKFRLGLFDDPFVDADVADDRVGTEAFRTAGEDAQRRSLVLLENRDTLPLRGRPLLYVQNIDPEVASQYADVVETPEEADLALLRIAAPFEPREGFLESLFHAGDLDFKGNARQEILDLLERVPTIVDIYLERPAVIPEIAAACVALIGSFGASDRALLDLLFGRTQPEARLPFELPSSMEAVHASREDVPHDTEKPLYPWGHGLGYST